MFPEVLPMIVASGQKAQDLSHSVSSQFTLSDSIHCEDL